MAIKGLTDIRKLVVNEKWYSLVQLHVDGEPVIPALLDLLDEEDRSIRLKAGQALGPISDVDVVAVVPALIKLKQFVRDEDGNIDPDFSSAAVAIGNNMNLEASIEVLKTAPHKRHEMDEESLKRMREILGKFRAEPPSGEGITDGSTNLDDYIYTPKHRRLK